MNCIDWHRGHESLVIQIARSEPIDQFLVHHPQFLFEAPRERLGIDPDNLVLLSEQAKCAAFELPFHSDEDGELVGEPEYGSAPHVPEILGWDHAETMAEAIQMAKSYVGPSPEITLMHHPPILMADVE